FTIDRFTFHSALLCDTFGRSTPGLHRLFRPGECIGRIDATHARSCGMADPIHHISDTRPVIRQLDDAAINRIAAGEVVER
ncbi:MAG TPA: hypothetical protein DCS45_13665, partial [Roseovarius nubinhibens]|nr:hypothetical protein [Roseovarius nubinhibens]